MKLKKPRFWDYKKPNIIAFLLYPIAFLLQIIKSNSKSESKKLNIKTICIGNIYLGGTGKTSLSIKLNEILNKNNIKTCFIKKYYKDQIDEQKILQNNGKLFLSRNRLKALQKAEEENYQIAIFDDGLQDLSINYDIKFVCFNNINWIGNGMTIPAGPLRENVNNLKKYKNLFLNGNLENIEEIKKQISNINPKITIHIGIYVPLNLNEFDSNENYLIFSGIGNHKTFVSMLKKNKLNIIKEIEFPDHYQYSEKDINKIIIEAKRLNSKIITTEKDYIKISDAHKSEIKFVKSELKIEDEKKLLNSIMK
tara:strand:- start:516 stop:1442 length:927 start_codon:yes stop_codon:yes gene_type:complete